MCFFDVFRGPPSAFFSPHVGFKANSLAPRLALPQGWTFAPNRSELESGALEHDKGVGSEMLVMQLPDAILEFIDIPPVRLSTKFSFACFRASSRQGSGTDISDSALPNMRC